MSNAFTGVMNSKWNEEVVEYLASKFNSVNPRIIVLSKTVFINATLAKFDNVSFVINAAGECLELSFSEVDKDKMDPLIQEILKWDAFTKYPSRLQIRYIVPPSPYNHTQTYKHLCSYLSKLFAIINPQPSFASTYFYLL